MKGGGQAGGVRKGAGGRSRGEIGGRVVAGARRIAGGGNKFTCYISKYRDGVHLSGVSGQISIRGTRGDVILNRNERMTLFRVSV